MLQEPVYLRSLLVLPVLLVVSITIGFLSYQDKELLGFLGLFALIGVAFICLRPSIGILLFMTTFLVTYSQWLPLKGYFTPNNLLGLLFMVLFLVYLYRERDLWFLQDRCVQLFGLLVIWMLFSSYLADQQLGNPFPALDQTASKVKFYISRFVFFVFFVVFIRTYRDVKLVLTLLVGLIFIAAASAVQGALSGGGHWRAAASMGISVAGNPNWFAFFCEFGIAIVWHYRRAVKSQSIGLILMAVVSILAVTVLLTASRSGFINLVLLFVLLGSAGRFSIKRQLQTLLVLTLVAYGANAVLTETHHERLGNLLPGASRATKGTSSTDGRFFILETGLKMVAERPLFGVGLGNFEWKSFELSDGALAKPPHNSYLWAMAEGGIPALLLYLMMFIHAFRNFWSVEQTARHPEVRALAAGLRTGFLIFLTFTIFAEFWHNIITYLIVGLAVVLSRLQRQERAATSFRRVPPPISQPIPQHLRV